MKLRCHPRYDLGGRLGLSRLIDVVDSEEKLVSTFDLMCAAIDNDIHNVEGSGCATLDAIQRVESSESSIEELAGNAWHTYISRDRVWFEGQYNQGEGGDVRFSQYKLAVQTYVRFLADPERKPFEVEFPP